jgi:protein-S-isoprenylcysteine O-methyltransferase Ste14
MSPSPTTLSPPPTPSGRSAAEERIAARMGAVVFRNRSWLPVPFLLVALFVPAPIGAWNWVVGLTLVAIGEGIRLAGVAAAGTATRRRSRDVQRLVTYGVFAWTRNPLYVGNFFIWMGFVVVSGVLWFLPVAMLIFAVEYSLIVAYEEGVLESIFGEEYLAYKRETPRWGFRTPVARRSGEHDWREAWRSEVSTFLQYAVLIVAFAVKQGLGARG